MGSTKWSIFAFPNWKQDGSANTCCSHHRPGTLHCCDLSVNITQWRRWTLGQVWDEPSCPHLGNAVIPRISVSLLLYSTVSGSLDLIVYLGVNISFYRIFTVRLCCFIRFCGEMTRLIRGAFDSAKNHKRQHRKRQSLTAKREKSQTPKFV